MSIPRDWVKKRGKKTEKRFKRKPKASREERPCSIDAVGEGGKPAWSGGLERGTVENDAWWGQGGEKGGGAA